MVYMSYEVNMQSLRAYYTVLPWFAVSRDKKSSDSDTLMPLLQ